MLMIFSVKDGPNAYKWLVVLLDPEQESYDGYSSVGLADCCLMMAF